MKMKIIKPAAVFIAALFLLMNCAGGPNASMIGNDELDMAIRELSDYLNRRIPQGSKVVFLNVKCDWPDFSEYILSGLIENVVNGETLAVVDRRQLEDLRAEMKFQYSGEVSDTSAQEIGMLLGAQTIVSGLVTEVGSNYRIQVRAISVQTASVQGLSSRNVDSRGPVVTALTTAPAALTAQREEAERKKQETELKKQEAEQKKLDAERNKRQEDERKKQEAERKRQEAELERQEATDNFLKTSGINIGGWLGLNFEYSDEGTRGGIFSYLSGGADLELRLFSYFGFQSGFEIFRDTDEPKDAPLFTSIETQTILQIPVLARITLPVYDGFILSLYGGLGINFPINNNSDITIQSPSPYSFIVGGDIGMGKLNGYLFAGYQFNRDLSDTVYVYQDKTFNYLGQRSIINVGIRLLIPFRKEEE